MIDKNYVWSVVSLKRTSFSQKVIFVNTKKANDTGVPSSKCLLLS